jgi:hypothetical protein
MWPPLYSLHVNRYASRVEFRDTPMFINYVLEYRVCHIPKAVHLSANLYSERYFPIYLISGNWFKFSSLKTLQPSVYFLMEI